MPAEHASDSHQRRMRLLTAVITVVSLCLSAAVAWYFQPPWPVLSFSPAIVLVILAIALAVWAIHALNEHLTPRQWQRQRPSAMLTAGAFAAGMGLMYAILTLAFVIVLSTGQRVVIAWNLKPDVELVQKQDNASAQMLVEMANMDPEQVFEPGPLGLIRVGLWLTWGSATMTTMLLVALFLPVTLMSRPQETVTPSSTNHPMQTVFISYRRSGGASAAQMVYTILQQHNYEIYLDVNCHEGGFFDEKLLREIEQRDHFVLILTPEAFSRCSNPQDWLRREIAHALTTGRNIVPLLMDGVVLPSADELPPDLRELLRWNGVVYSYHHHQQSVDHLLKSLNVIRSASRTTNVDSGSQQIPISADDSGTIW